MNWLELVAAVLGIANIVLLVRRSIWNYAFALAMVSLSARVFYVERLYSDALLQGFFFVLNVYGWWNWSRHGGAGGIITVERLGWRGRAGWLVGATLASLGWGMLMARTDAAFPYLDGAIAMFSVTAQILLARRLIENWLVWIGVDVLAIGVYFTKHLFAFAGLYAVMLLLCLFGLIEWRQAERRVRLAAVPA